MALADAISTPQVGKTLLNTFGVLAEENRRRKELELSAEKNMQNLLLREAGLAIREKGMELNAIRTGNAYEVAMQKLTLAQSEEARKAALAELDMKKREFALEQQQGDFQSAREAAEMLSMPDEKTGLTLHQRLLSDDVKESESAMREFVGIAGKLQGKGPQTKNLFDSVRKGFNDRLRQLEGQREAEIAAQREERMRTTAEKNANMAGATLEERKRHNMATEATANARVGKMGGASVNKHGEYFPGGKAKVNVPGTKGMTLDEIREVLATGGAAAKSLETALKNVDAGTTPDGEPKPSWIDDATIGELRKQGLQILQLKKAAPKTATEANNSQVLPAGDTLTPASTDPLEDIFKRPGAPAATPASTPVDDVGVLPPLPPVPGYGAAAVQPATEFFGLPRQVTMA